MYTETNGTLKRAYSSGQKEIEFRKKSYKKKPAID